MVSKGPIALGPGKLAFVELPQNRTKKDLSKLFKMLALALGDEGEEQTQKAKKRWARDGGHHPSPGNSTMHLVLPLTQWALRIGIRHGLQTALRGEGAPSRLPCIIVPPPLSY